MSHDEHASVDIEIGGEVYTITEADVRTAFDATESTPEGVTHKVVIDGDKKGSKAVFRNISQTPDRFYTRHADTVFQDLGFDIVVESGPDEQDETSHSNPTVWIEKTQVEGRPYKQDGDLALGNAIIAPSRDEGGQKRYESLREADVGDVVLHLLQDQEEIVGVSRIASELDEDFEGPPDNRWTQEQVEQGGYKRDLEGYTELDDPIDIFDDVLGNEIYADRLRQIRDSHDGKIVYNKRLALNQGHYFTEVPPEFLSILADESADLPDILHTFGVEIPASPVVLPDPVESYDTISGAMDDIHERLEQSSHSNWLGAELTNIVIDDWSDVLTNFGPDSTVSIEEEVRLTQLRDLYDANASRFEDLAEELGSGRLNHISKPQTLFVAFLRDLQSQAGLTTNVNQVKIKIIHNEEYEIETGESGPGEDDPPSHPLLDHLDTLSASTPIRKFTAPPDYWLTTLQYGTVSFETQHEPVWDDIEPGELVFLHTQAEPSDEALTTQPSGIFAVGILGEKTTKNEHWWTDETDADPFPYLVTFDRLFTTSDLDRLDLATPVSDQPTAALDDQLDALTDGLLDFETVNAICEGVNGSSFPAQSAHGVFRDDEGRPDHERPRALLEALSDRLQETATVNAHTGFTGQLSADPLADLYFLGDGDTARTVL